jgi:hypothetical protein
MQKIARQDKSDDQRKKGSVLRYAARWHLGETGSPNQQSPEEHHIHHHCSGEDRAAGCFSGKLYFLLIL